VCIKVVGSRISEGFFLSSVWMKLAVGLSGRSYVRIADSD
jgi:hypothetical protein